MSQSLGHIDDFIREIDQTKNLDEILAVLRTQIMRLGFHRFTYWLMWQPNGARASIWLTSYPAQWINNYLENRMDGDDLVARYGAVHNRPYIWSDVKSKYDLTKAQKIVFGEAAAAGLRAGGSVPIHGPGAAKAMFSVANDEPEELFQMLFLANRHELHLLATYAHEKIIDLGLHKTRDLDLRLTAREIEVLTWTARGKTRWETSCLLSVSEETIKRHIDNICRKLNTQNKTQATAVAIMNGLIIP